MMFRNGTEGSGTERISFRNGTERIFVLDGAEQNGTQPPNVNPDQKNCVVTKTFAPKFWSEPSDREVHSSYGDYFRDNFCDCDSEPLSGNFQSTFGQLPDNFRATFGPSGQQIRGKAKQI